MNDFQLTDDEREKLEGEIVATHHFNDVSDL